MGGDDFLAPAQGWQRFLDVLENVEHAYELVGRIRLETLIQRPDVNRVEFRRVFRDNALFDFKALCCLRE